MRVRTNDHHYYGVCVRCLPWQVERYTREEECFTFGLSVRLESIRAVVDKYAQAEVVAAPTRHKAVRLNIYASLPQLSTLPIPYTIIMGVKTSDASRRGKPDRVQDGSAFASQRLMPTAVNHKLCCQRQGPNLRVLPFILKRGRVPPPLSKTHTHHRCAKSHNWFLAC